MIRIVLAAAAGLVLTVCGYGDRSCAPCPVAPTPRLTQGFDVLITDTDRAVAVRSGQRVELILHAKPGMSDWSGVNVDDDTVLRAVPTGITAARGVTIAGYEAARPGTATIRATATPLCTPGQACPLFAMIFEVQVIVT